MVIFLEMECILSDCEKLPQTMDAFSQVSTPHRIPSEKMGSLIPPWAAIFLDCQLACPWWLGAIACLWFRLPVKGLPYWVAEKYISSLSQPFKVLKSPLRFILSFVKEDTLFLIPYPFKHITALHHYKTMALVSWAAPGYLSVEESKPYSLLLYKYWFPGQLKCRGVVDVQPEHKC